MAKSIKKIMSITLLPDITGLAFEKCTITYEVGSSDDADLSKIANTEITLSGADLTGAEDLFALCLSSVETQEGI